MRGGGGAWGGTAPPRSIYNQGGWELFGWSVVNYLKAEIVPGEEAWVSDFDAFRRQFEPTITETSKDQNMTLKESLGFTALSLLLPFLLLTLQAGCTTPAPTGSELQRLQAAPTASDLQRLQGTWEGVVVGDKSDDKYTITVTGNSLHFHRDSKFWFATTITLPPDTDPRQLRATIKDGAPGQESSVGKVVVAIFKIEDGLLTLAAGGDEEAPKSFEADQGLTRYELRKVQPQKSCGC